MNTCYKCSNPQDGYHNGLCLECYDEKYLVRCNECGDTFHDLSDLGLCSHCINNNPRHEKTATYIFQWSIPQNNPAVSEWREYITKVTAKDMEDATSKFRAMRKETGTWMLLDSFKE